MSESAEKAGSKLGSNVSKMSEQRRLKIQAEMMEQKSQMELEKRERELELEKTRREMERNLERQHIDIKTKPLVLQAESEIAVLKRKKAFEK